jgi:hypothetical protein
MLDPGRPVHPSLQSRRNSTESASKSSHHTVKRVAQAAGPMKSAVIVSPVPKPNARLCGAPGVGLGTEREERGGVCSAARPLLRAQTLTHKRGGARSRLAEAQAGRRHE